MPPSFFHSSFMRQGEGTCGQSGTEAFGRNVKAVSDGHINSGFSYSYFMQIKSFQMLHFRSIVLHESCHIWHKIQDVLSFLCSSNYLNFINSIVQKSSLIEIPASPAIMPVDRVLSFSLIKLFDLCYHEFLILVKQINLYDSFIVFPRR